MPENSLREKIRLYLADVKARNPNKSACTALLGELLNSEESDGWFAAILLGDLKCRKAVPKIASAAQELAGQLRMPTEEWDSDLPGCKKLECLLCALGRIDSKESQGVLAALLQTSPNPRVRADVMEFMAFGNRFDPELVLPYASLDYSTPEILSALYAMHCRHYKYRPDEVRRRLMPLMDHPYPQVQSYMIELFTHNTAHRDFLESLKTHSSERIQAEAAKALVEMDRFWSKV
jgi:hypothetical protein